MHSPGLLWAKVDPWTRILSLSSTCPCSQVCGNMKWLAKRRGSGCKRLISVLTSALRALLHPSRDLQHPARTRVSAWWALLPNKWCQNIPVCAGDRCWGWDGSSRGCPSSSQRMVACFGGAGGTLHWIQLRDEEISILIFPASDLYSFLEAVGSALIRANQIKPVLLEKWVCVSTGPKRHFGESKLWL